MLRGVILAGMVAAGLVPVTWWLGVWSGSKHQLPGGSYDHQLRAAVRHSYCEGTPVSHDGWGAPSEPLNARASARFVVSCEFTGPTVMWLHFRSASDLRDAWAVGASQSDSLLSISTVCVSSSRAELVAFYDVEQWNVNALCSLREGRIVRRPVR